MVFVVKFGASCVGEGGVLRGIRKVDKVWE